MGPIIAEALWSVGIEKKVAVFQADNADSNDLCVAALLRELMPSADRDAEQQLRRVRRFGHIINLVARALLDGDNKA